MFLAKTPSCKSCPPNSVLKSLSSKLCPSTYFKCTFLNDFWLLDMKLEDRIWRTEIWRTAFGEQNLQDSPANSVLQRLSSKFCPCMYFKCTFLDDFWLLDMNLEDRSWITTFVGKNLEDRICRTEFAGQSFGQKYDEKINFTYIPFMKSRFHKLVDKRLFMKPKVYKHFVYENNFTNEQH